VRARKRLFVSYAGEIAARTKMNLSAVGKIKKVNAQRERACIAHR
jgi:hypothetical protein